MHNSTSFTDHFFVQTDACGRLTKISTPDILYLQSNWNYLRIFLKQEQYMVYFTLKDMTKHLATQAFVQVHKSYLVNVDKIQATEGNRIWLCDGTEIPIGPTFKKAFMQRLEDRVLRRPSSPKRFYPT